MSLTTYLVSAWELDEASGNAVDSHGSNHLAETSGTISSVATGIGGITVREFLAADTEHLMLADNASLSIGTSVSFEASIWVCLISFTSSISIWGKTTDVGTAPNVEWQITYNSASGTTFSASDGTNRVNLIDPQVLIIGKWYLIHVWVDRSNNLQGMRINNNPAITAANTFGVWDSNKPFVMGGEVALTRLLNGYLSRARFWKGGILTDSERDQNWNNGLGLSYAQLSSPPVLSLPKRTEILTGGYQSGFAQPLPGIHTLTSAPTVDATSLLTNLVSAWELNEASGNALDSVGSNHLAEFSGTIGSVAIGIGGNTVREFLSADTEYLGLADNASLSIGTSVSFEVAIWVYLTALSGTVSICGKTVNIGSGPNCEWQVACNSANGTSFTASDGTTLTQVFDPQVPPLNKWHLIHGWVDRSNNLQGVRVNNKAAITTANTTGVWDSNKSFVMGGEPGLTRLIDGCLSRARFWKGRVLTDAERDLSWNEGIGLTYAQIATAFTKSIDLMDGSWQGFGFTVSSPQTSTVSYTATAALSISAVTLAAAVNFTVVNTAASNLQIAPVLLSASVTFAVPSYTAVASLQLQSLQVAASCTFTAPVYTASAVLSITATQLAATVLHAVAVYSATSALNITPTTLAASSTFTKPVYSATTSLVVVATQLAASVTNTTPVYTAAANLAINPTTVSAAVSHTRPVYTAAVSLSITKATITAAAQHSVPVFSATANLIISAAQIAADMDFMTPIYTATANLVVGSPYLEALVIHSTTLGNLLLVRRRAVLL